MNHPDFSLLAIQLVPLRNNPGASRTAVADFLKNVVDGQLRAISLRSSAARRVQPCTIVQTVGETAIDLTAEASDCCSIPLWFLRFSVGYKCRSLRLQNKPL